MIRKSPLYYLAVIFMMSAFAISVIGDADADGDMQQRATASLEDKHVLSR